MAKVGNETKLVVMLFGERAAIRKATLKSATNPTEEAAYRAYVEGLEWAVAEARIIIAELEEGK